MYSQYHSQILCKYISIMVSICGSIWICIYIWEGCSFILLLSNRILIIVNHREQILWGKLFILEVWRWNWWISIELEFYYHYLLMNIYRNNGSCDYGYCCCFIIPTDQMDCTKNQWTILLPMAISRGMSWQLTNG